MIIKGIEVIDYIVSGVISGCIIALGSIGLTLTFGILRFANLSHGDLLGTLAYIGLACERLFNNIVLGILGAIIGGSLIGLLLEKIIWRPLRKKGGSAIAMIIVSIGIALAARHIVMAIAGPKLYFYHASGRVFNLGIVDIDSIQLSIFFIYIISMFFCTIY